MYLLLGPPSSGKTSLLRAIAGRLATKHGEEMTGSVTYNGKSFEDQTHCHIENAIAYIDQLDIHAPRLTVDETFEFAFQCKNGGTHIDLADFSDDKTKMQVARAIGKRADNERLLVNLNLKSLGLTHVRDTFVGDDDIRGVSGGQRRRVTVGEMMLGASPVLLGDEISNGLDASSTFEMIQTLTLASKDFQRTRIISLLQPSPETVALFDELILLAQGQILYAGPISEVEDYFAKIGYRAPPYMDVADFLQLLSTPADCKSLFQPPLEVAGTQATPYDASQLAELFRQNVYGERIQAHLNAPHRHVWGSSHNGVNLSDEVDHLDDRRYHRKYVNSFPRSTALNLKRNLTLWMRDRRVLIANAAKNVIMGISVGGVFFQTDDVVSILGVLFQGMLFIMLGAMTTAPGFVDERPIFYKQADANFFPSLPYVLGKSISKIPQVRSCKSHFIVWPIFYHGI
jgi:ABC-type multidrug transport system ATPase subunit